MQTIPNSSIFCVKNGDFPVFAGTWAYHIWTNNKVKTSFNDIKIIYSFKVSILSFIVKHLILLHPLTNRIPAFSQPQICLSSYNIDHYIMRFPANDRISRTSHHNIIKSLILSHFLSLALANKVRKEDWNHGCT